MARKFISEITTIKERVGYNTRYQLLSDLLDIKTTLKIDSYLGINDAFWKYVPISTIACVEEFFNSIIKELIDFGSPYSDNTVKFNEKEKIRFDFDIINAIQRRTVTVGEFISHILPHNNLNDLNANLTTIIGGDFLFQLKQFITNKSDKTELYENFDWSKSLEDINRFFTLRHIFCHEFGNNLQIEKNEFIRGIKNIINFLEITNDYVFNLLYPNHPETEYESNRQANERLIMIGRQFEEIKNFLNQNNKLLDGRDINIFNQAIDKWYEFRELYAKFNASNYEGSTIYYMFLYESQSFITSHMMEMLQKIHKDLFSEHKIKLLS